MGYVIYPELLDYLKKQDILHDEVSRLEGLLDRLILGSSSKYAIIELREWENTHELLDYREPLMGEAVRLTRAEGIARIMQLAQTPSIIGLCGRPAVGKSRLLRELKRNGLEVIDEFGHEPQYSTGAREEMEWAIHMYPDLFQKTPNEKEAERVKAEGKTIVVADARLDSRDLNHFFDHKFYLDRTWPTRARNLLMQAYLGRRLGVLISPEWSRINERYNYEFQKTSCDAIIDLHR